MSFLNYYYFFHSTKCLLIDEFHNFFVITRRLISVPPHWVVEPKDISVSAGKDLMLHCQAEGYPVPTIVWKRAMGKFYTSSKIRGVSIS